MLKTSRLLLRPWREDDFLWFAKLNEDSEVMEHFPAIPSRERSFEVARKLQAKIDDQGWGLWAVEVIGGAPFIGFVGLDEVDEDVPCAPAIEIGWRLARAHWGKGYATEAGLRSLDYAFSERGWPEVVAMTALTNIRSERVMQRLGMVRDLAADFDHPRVPDGHPVQRHMLYRIRASDGRPVGG